jgi:hypothetical protein
LQRGVKKPRTWLVCFFQRRKNLIFAPKTSKLGGRPLLNVCMLACKKDTCSRVIAETDNKSLKIK